MKRNYLLISLTTTLLLLFACGGGGGGGDDPDPIVYTGLKDPAVITTENVDVLVEGIWSSETDLFDMSEIIGVTTEETDPVKHLPANLLLSQVVANAVQQIDFANVLPGTIQTFSETQECDSGSTYIQIAVDDITGDFDGYMTYYDCVESGEYKDGTANFFGSVDIYNKKNIQMTMTFTDLTGSYESESYTYSGEVQGTLTASTANMIMDFVVRDNYTGTVYWYEDYRINLTEMYDQVALTMNGRFYHPNHGYIDVTTTDSILIRDYQDWPYVGIVIATGESSSFKINCQEETEDINTYTLSVDADGDGVYETETIENW